MISTKYLSNNYFLIGLSSDEKPIDGITNGTAYLEMDTGKVYILDAEYVRWLELGEETPLPEQLYKHEISWTGTAFGEEGDPLSTSGNFTFVISSNQTPTTMEELFDLINDSNATVKFNATTESDSEEFENISFVGPIVLFDNKSKLFMNNVIVYDSDNDAYYGQLMITSFTDTVISENN